jgi:hypothetical protein
MTRFLALGVGGLPVVPMVACGSSHHAERAENREENREATSSFFFVKNSVIVSKL